MIAVIMTGGKQYKVAPGQTLLVEKLDAEEGKDVTFDKVLLAGNEDGKDVKVGQPFLDGAKVTATVEKQGRSKKLRVVKYKRKVRYKRVYGHRQPFTKVVIKDIVA